MIYKVTNAMKTGSYQSKFGEMVKYTVQLEGVDEAVEMSQKPTTEAPKPGDELEGTIEDTQYGKRFKKAQNPSGVFQSKATDPATRASIEAQTSLNAAITAVRDYYSFVGGPQDMKVSEYAGKIIQLSKAFQSSLAGNMPQDTVEVVKQVMPEAQIKPEDDQINLDGIPF